VERRKHHHRVQNGSGFRPASYPMSNRGSFLGGKAAGAWRWPLTSIQCRGQRMLGGIPPLPQYDFMAWCSFENTGITTYVMFWINLWVSRLWRRVVLWYVFSALLDFYLRFIESENVFRLLWLSTSN
jgi:hypothetical protein